MHATAFDSGRPRVLWWVQVSGCNSNWYYKSLVQTLHTNLPISVLGCFSFLRKMLRFLQDIHLLKFMTKNKY